jgi:hypothetical protein
MASTTPQPGQAPHGCPFRQASVATTSPAVARPRKRPGLGKLTYTTGATRHSARRACGAVGVRASSGAGRTDRPRNYGPEAERPKRPGWHPRVDSAKHPLLAQMVEPSAGYAPEISYPHEAQGRPRDDDLPGNGSGRARLRRCSGPRRPPGSSRGTVRAGPSARWCCRRGTGLCKRSHPEWSTRRLSRS